MADTEVKKWLTEHQKSDLASFDAIHSHLDRLDKATNTDLIVYKLDELRTKMDSMEKGLGVTYVTKTEFDPIKKLVYGLVALILMGVVGGILALVIKGAG